MSQPFYAAWAEHYDAVFPVGPKARFVAAHIPGPGRLLDLGCATGGVDFALAELGYRVHGVDLEPALVARAAARLEREPSPKLGFAIGDMLALPAPAQPYDGVICLGNTLVHLMERADRAAALRGMAAQVGSDGRLVLQIVNYDRVLAQAVASLPLLDTDTVRFERRYTGLSAERLTFEADLTVKGSGRVLSVAQPLVPLTRAQLDTELRDAGWLPQGWFGSYRGEPWSPDSFGCICQAVRGA
jgi:glycine/sarcosine N-methyltransferase